jgi:hypothetical protein
MKYPGIYRGYVVDNDDSLEKPPYMGRIKVNVPQIYGEQVDPEGLPWAEPCVPFFGGGLSVPVNQAEGTEAAPTEPSGIIAIPSIGATVWVIFEEGDVQHPVYMGTWYGKSEEVPSFIGETDKYPNIFVFKTPWGSNAVLRVIQTKLLELMYDDMKVLMESNKDAEHPDEPSKMTISSAGGSILISCPTGKLSLQANEIEIDSTHDLTVRAGHYRIDPWLGPVVDTEGDLDISVTKNTYFHTHHKGIIKTAKDGGWFMHATNVSGFEEHGGKM